MSNLFALLAALAAAATLDGMNGITRHATRGAVVLMFIGALGHAFGNTASDTLAFGGMGAFLLADRRLPFMPLHTRWLPRVSLAMLGAASAFTVWEWFA